MPPIVPPGKEDFELVCARIFCQWRLGSVCRHLHLSKKKTCWWAEKTPRPCCLSTAVYLGSRSLQAQEHCWNKTHGDTLLLPSAAALLHPAAHTSRCVQCSPSPARAGGAKRFPVCSGLGGPKVIQLCWQEFLRLKRHLYCHGSFHSQRWFYFATLFLVDTAQVFYALEKIQP